MRSLLSHLRYSGQSIAFRLFFFASLYASAFFCVAAASPDTESSISGIISGSSVPSFAAILIPFAASATVAVLLDSQYNHGTIRNMLVSGHTRTEIFLADLLAMSAAAVIYFVCYQLAVFSVAVFAFDYDGYRLKAALVSLSVMLVMLICVSTVVSLLLGNLMRGGKLTVVILVVQYALNLSFVLGMFKKDNKVMELLARLFPQSSLFDFSYYTVPDGIEKNLMISAVMIVVFSVIGLIHFQKCDIK